MSPPAFAAASPLVLSTSQRAFAVSPRRHQVVPMRTSRRAAVATPRMEAEPADEGRVARAFDIARNLAHKAGITSDRVRYLAEKAMGHKAEALSAVEKVMGKAGLDADQISRVSAVLEKVDLTALVVDGDTARAKVLDVERTIKDAAGGEAETVKGALSNFVSALDLDGDGHISKTEMAKAVAKFGSAAKAIAAAQSEALQEANTIKPAPEGSQEQIFPKQD